MELKHITTQSGETAKTPQTHKSSQGSQEPQEPFVYCGPSIPSANLSENAILRGTRAEIQAFYADVLEAYPQAKGLIVPVCQLADTKQRIHTIGNIANKHYRDIASMVRGGKEASKWDMV